MSPDDCIAALDRALEAAGENVVLRRIYGQAGSTTAADTPTMRAFVTSFRPEELVGGIAQTDSKVILSPSPIARAGWPGAEAPSAAAPIPSLPRRNDKIIAGGRTRNVEFVNPLSVNGKLVRIELRISG